MVGFLCFSLFSLICRGVERVEGVDGVERLSGGIILERTRKYEWRMMEKRQAGVR